MKSIRDVKIGDTFTAVDNPASEPLPGYKPVKPMVFCGMYPADPGGFDTLRSSLEKLSLNDSSFFYEPETSSALGFGFRCGFRSEKAAMAPTNSQRHRRHCAVALFAVVYRQLAVAMVYFPAKLLARQAIDAPSRP